MKVLRFYMGRNIKVRRIFFAGLLVSTVIIMIGCQSLWYHFLNFSVDIAPDRFVFEQDNTKLSIPIVTSKPLKIEEDETEYLIIIIHGAGLNAEKSFETAQQFITSLKMDNNRFLVLAPQIIEGVKLEEKGLLFWDQKWREGGMSLSTRRNEGCPASVVSM